MKKRFMAMAMTLMTVISLGSIPVMANARSNVDSAITNFRVEPSNYNQIAMREKDDTTPIYLWITEAKNNRYSDFRVKVFANGSKNVMVDGHGNIVEFVNCYVGRKQSVRNNVREDGYNRVALGFQSRNYVETQSITGEWSPDSTGRYDYAYKER